MTGTERTEAHSPDEAALLLSRSTSHETIEENGHHKHWFGIIIVATLIVFLVDFGGFVSLAPLTRLYESISCYKYYATHDPSGIPVTGIIPEEMCKVSSVQDTVAVLNSWQNVWDVIPGILLAVPYASLADRWGRKPILLLAFFGLVCSFGWILLVCYLQLPLYAVWLSSVWMLIGGGPVVAITILYSIATDVTPSNRRTAVFLWLQSAVLASELLAPALSSALMRSSLWRPLILALGLDIASFLLIFALPETLRANPSDVQASPEANADAPLLSMKNLRRKMQDFCAAMRETKDFVLRDRSVLLLILANASAGLLVQLRFLLLQYASVRFHWSLANTALLGTLRAAVNLVLFLVVLPAVSVFMTDRLHHKPERGDLEVAKYSAILMMVGMFAIGLSPDAVLMVIGLVIYTCGTGFYSAIRSVAVALVGGDRTPHTATLFSAMSVSSGLGVIVSGPLLPITFHWGQQIGGVGLGLPFLLGGLLVASAAIIMFFVRIPETQTETETESEQGEPAML